MRARDIAVDWLQAIDFQVQSLYEPPTIEGVVAKDLEVIMDGRGELTVLWSQPWIDEGFSTCQHVYNSTTDQGVVKCWHLHEVHTDQFVVTRGKLQVSLVDLREDSRTFGHVSILFLGTLKPCTLKIPPMVMHGWKALSYPEVTVLNLQSHVYTPDDEYRFPWNCVLEEIWQPRNG